MSSRAKFVGFFLSVTALAIGLELGASFDDSPDTVPWTELIVEYIPGEVTAALIGVLLAWLPVHFGLRYWRKSKAVADLEAAEKAALERKQDSGASPPGRHG